MENETSRPEEEYQASEEEHEIYQPERGPEPKPAGSKKPLWLLLGLVLLIILLYKLYVYFSAAPKQPTALTSGAETVTTTTPALVTPTTPTSTTVIKPSIPSITPTTTVSPAANVPKTQPAAAALPTTAAPQPVTPTGMQPQAQALPQPQKTVLPVKLTTSPTMPSAPSALTVPTPPTVATAPTAPSVPTAVKPSIAPSAPVTITTPTLGATGTATPMDALQNNRLDALEQGVNQNRVAIQNIQNQINSLASSVTNLQAGINTLNNTLANIKSAQQQIHYAPHIPVKSTIIKHKKLKHYIGMQESAYLAPARTTTPSAPPPSQGMGQVSGGAQYYVKAMIQGRAWLVTADGTSTVTISSGDYLPGYGLIEDINPSQGIVTTSSGGIIQFNPADR